MAAAGDAGPQDAYKQINVYGEVLQHIQTDYVEVPNIPKVTDGALRGLLESLDADSSYLTPAEYKTTRTTGRQGAGRPRRLQALRLCDRSLSSSRLAADKAGLVDGDIIEAIGMEDTRSLSLAMIQLLLQGAPGSQLQLAVIGPHSAKRRR